MAYDKKIGERVRAAVEAMADGAVTGRAMMGAYCFMVGGRMACGVTGDALMLRLGVEGAEAALTDAHVRPMAIGKRQAPKAFVLVDPPGFADDDALRAWIGRSLAFLASDGGPK